MTKALPTSKLSRGAVVGKTMLKIGSTHAKGFVKRSLGKKQTQDQSHKETHEEIADILFDALGQLKGVSVKIAQQVALGMPFLPPEYLDKMNQSFNAIPPINKALVRKIIKAQLGDYPQNIFDTFQAEAFAAASLGQVHLATKDQQQLAVKVQYTGIRESIKSDMSLIHFGLKRFAKGQNVDHLITEIEERLYEETDYILEAQNIAFFRDNLNIKNIIIPKVYPKISTDKVLCTEFLDGLDFHAYMQNNPSQKEKNRYAQLIFDAFFKSLYSLKRIHADPNPANFVFLPKGILGMIDFGCVKAIDEKFLKAYTELHLCFLDNADDMQTIKVYVALGMIEAQSPEKMQKFYHDVIRPLDSLYKEPLMGESYDFAIHNDFSKKGFEMIFEVQQKQYKSVHKLNEQFIFINRTLMGYYALFEKMSAKIDTRKVRKMMREYS
jgi:predicted unusual protein kinase regulating ubiquinone biosynthesis (AarF/ABC1/UbiB family)